MSTKTSAIPSSEGRFLAYGRNFVDHLIADPARYGLTESKVAPLEGLYAQFDTDAQKAVAAKDAARAAVTERDESRAAFTNVIRELTRIVQANTDVSNAAREDAGIPVHKTSRTPVGVPKTFPVATIIGTDRLEHTVSFTNSSTNRRSKPAGVTGAEVYVAVADTAPTDPKQYRFVAFATRTPLQVTFESEDGGKTANYLLRWVNTKGEKGPWSSVLSSTIPAV